MVHVSRLEWGGEVFEEYVVSFSRLCLSIELNDNLFSWLGDVFCRRNLLFNMLDPHVYIVYIG